jgi:non-specific serine/threonine protein kinase/serine/threonine-protein kinase
MHVNPPGGSDAQGAPPPWERVHALFHDVLELDAAARDARLAQLDRDEPAIAREVRSLLHAHAESSGFLGTPPAGAVLRAVAPGDRLGPYRIVEEIGHGGMGVVYRATRDDENFTKDVAIKLIDPGMRSDEVLRRFRAERQILAMLDHPHIARLLDGGTAPDGSPYLVMEHVAGRPLLAFCDARGLGVDGRIALFLTVCDAVQFAHQRLVVHRDLKSDNILVTDDGSPRLLDFGIAKLLAPDPGREVTVTAPMHRMMTPDYASPEQIRGEPATVAGDVYSLGVILYELLSGARPLTFTTRSPEEILRVVTHEDPVPPSAAAARSPGGEAASRRSDTTARLKRRLTGDLDDIVLKALEKDPARRYGSVDLLAQDLRRHVEGMPVLARGRSTAYLVSRFVHRHRAAVVATSLVVLALLAGLAGTIWQAGVARRERDVAQRRFADVRGLARAVVFDIHDAIANLPGSTKAREVLVGHALRYLDDLSREAGGDLALQRELAVAYSKVGDVQGQPMFPNLGQTAAAKTSYEKALTLLREVTAAQPESSMIVHDEIVVMQRLMDLLGVMGRPEEAMALGLEARERSNGLLARHPADPVFQGDLSITCQRLADLKLAAGDTLGALEECRTNVNIAEQSFRAHPEDPRARRAALIASAKLAHFHAIRDERDSALVAYQRAEALAGAAVAAQPNDTDAARDLSIVYSMHGTFLAEADLDAGLAVYDKGMKIAERLAAADPANALPQGDVASGHFEIGAMLMQGRRYEGAERRFQEAFDRFTRIAAADTGNIEHRLNQARSARRAGEACEALARGPGDRVRWRSEAEAWFTRSLALYRTLDRKGALTGEEAAAPREIERALAALRTAT